MQTPDFSFDPTSHKHQGLLGGVFADPQTDCFAESARRAAGSGMSGVVTRFNEQAEERFAEATQVWVDFQEGRIPDHLILAALNPQRDSYLFNELHRLYPAVFNEAMTSTDFQSFSDNMLYRQMLAELEHQGLLALVHDEDGGQDQHQDDAQRDQDGGGGAAHVSSP